MPRRSEFDPGLRPTAKGNDARDRDRVDMPPMFRARLMHARTPSAGPQPEALDHVVEALGALRLQVPEERAALADHHQETAARRVVVLVILEVLGELPDPLRQQGDLDLRRTGVPIARAIVLDQLRLGFGGDAHSRLRTPGRPHLPSNCEPPSRASAPADPHRGPVVVRVLRFRRAGRLPAALGSVNPRPRDFPRGRRVATGALQDAGRPSATPARAAARRNRWHDSQVPQGARPPS